MTTKIKFSLAEILEEINDFRNPNQIKYELNQIILVVIIGILAGLIHTLHISEFAKNHRFWFKNKLGLDNIPSHDTLERVLSLISFTDVESATILWLEQLLEDKQLKKRLKIDAKKTDKKSPNTTTFIRAFIGNLKLVIGSKRIPEYHNEITEIPKLLKKLAIKGFLVSIDAIGTQVEIVKLLLSKDADYLLCVKKNQKLLREELMLFIKSEIAYEKAYSFDKAHGRFEKRIFYKFNDVAWLHKRFPRWDHIKSFGLIERYRKEKHKESSINEEIYICSRDLTAKEFLAEIRDHWSIENNLHWPLNQAFQENKVRSKCTSFINNFSLLLNFTLTLLSNSKPANISFNLQKIRLSSNLDNIPKLLYSGV
jgi:predicted transposase YbfD/YdcC